MKSASLETRKIAFIKEFLNIKSEKVLTQLERLLRAEKENTFEAMSVQEYESEIDQALEDSTNGRMIKATDLKAKIQKWS